ncbi:MAG: hypothetical protein V2B18_15330, partial [Pseudomonadota bacterium]
DLNCLEYLLGRPNVDCPGTHSASAPLFGFDQMGRASRPAFLMNIVGFPVRFSHDDRAHAPTDHV